MGMDYFAKPNDELTIAQQAGQLHRNFQSYTTQPKSDLLSFRMTSISMLQDVYLGNHKCLKDFYRAIDAHTLPIEKGVRLSKDNLIRRTVICVNFNCQCQTWRPSITSGLIAISMTILLQLCPNSIRWKLMA